MVDKDSRLSTRRQCELLGVARNRLKAKERQESAENSHRVLRTAVQRYGRPEIVNSDQGAQFTCKEWVEYLEANAIQISIDGKLFW